MGDLKTEFHIFLSLHYFCATHSLKEHADMYYTRKFKKSLGNSS